MTKTGVRVAIAEAKRFLSKAELALKRAETNTDRSQDGLWQSKENAAMRRSSLDLTRALADMRGTTSGWLRSERFGGMNNERSVSPF